MAIRYVITQEQMGIFIGASMGMSFWSLLESAAQSVVVVWDSPEDALGFMSRWRPVVDPDKFKILPVETADPNWATVPELIKAGLGHMVGKLFEDMTVQGAIQ